MSLEAFKRDIVLIFAKKILAKKGSYYAKHKLQIHGDEAAPSLPTVQITEEQQQAFADGKVLLIDKPLHWTSFDVVRKIRNTIRIKKVGHAGTLDPLATGLLIVCTGKFTKNINEYMAREKEYTGTITLGAITPTYDLESTPEQQKDISFITPDAIQQAAASLTGDIMQMPPIYSAIKKEGVALYTLARRGEDVELKARPVHIAQFEITNIDLPVISFKIICSTGTYIRSLAHDLGAALGCGAYLSSLRRTAIGEFLVDDALTLETFMNSISEDLKKDSLSQ
jgi:tRNA pseudouridine55 synthase